jgi:hypothetical protein
VGDMAVDVGGGTWVVVAVEEGVVVGRMVVALEAALEQKEVDVDGKETAAAAAEHRAVPMVAQADIGGREAAAAVVVVVVAVVAADAAVDDDAVAVVVAVAAELEAMAH